MNPAMLIASLLLAPLLLWSAVLLVQAVCALWPAPAPRLSPSRPRIAVLVPAHDEAAVIADTLNTLRPQLRPCDRLLVVADNCTDDTARIAAAAGAEVLRRENPSLRGKGYALDFGIRHLAHYPPEVLVCMDADCTADAGAIDTLARACLAGARPIQAAYLMRSPGKPTMLHGLRALAWRFRNLVRPLGCLRLGLPCQLMGTGMAFPWALIADAPLANAHLVEDMALGVHLAQRRAAPLFCPQAVVRSAFPAQASGARSQRRRWEHGHLGMLARAPGLLLQAVRTRNPGLLALAVDLSVPPLALLVLMLLGAGGIGLVLAPALAWQAMIALLLLAAVILLGWWRHGRDTVGLSTLLLAPVYALVKLPLYLAFLLRRQVEWERSSRD